MSEVESGYNIEGRLLLKMNLRLTEWAMVYLGPAA